MGASVGTVLGLLRNVADDIGCVTIIGHIPTLQDLALHLAGAGDPELRVNVAAKCPPAPR